MSGITQVLIGLALGCLMSSKHIVKMLSKNNNK